MGNDFLMGFQKPAGFSSVSLPQPPTVPSINSLTRGFCPLQAIRLSLEQALPPEPKEENAEPVSKLRIRTPSGEFLERRFLATNKLQIVFDFVASKGFPWDEFKLLSTFPRRDVSSHSCLGKYVQMGDNTSLSLAKVVQAKCHGTPYHKTKHS